MKLFDLHCDTAMALYAAMVPLKSNNRHISLDKAACFDKYVQLTAFFTSPRVSDEDGWNQFWRARRRLLDECDRNGVTTVSSAAELEAFDKSNAKTAFIITIEDVRMLAGHLERVEQLYEGGVRVVTPLWGGETIIGGSHNTDMGLTPFGRAAVEEMLNVGITPDISHASFRSTDEILDLCEKHGKSPIATHMNSYVQCEHTRNLTDERFERLVKLGGIAGVSLCPPHLLKGEVGCTSDDAVRHFVHYNGLHPENVAFGCDLDGTDLPEDMHDIRDLVPLTEKLANLGMNTDAITYDNAYRFMMKVLK